MNSNNSVAVILDMDGTMVDNMGIHMEAWQSLFRELGLNLTLDQVGDKAYGRSLHVIHRVFPNRFTEEEVRELIHRKEEAYRDIFLPRLQLLPGLEKLINSLHSKGLRMGIGTGADRPKVDFLLDNLGLRDFFSALNFLQPDQK